MAGSHHWHAFTAVQDDLPENDVVHSRSRAHVSSGQLGGRLDTSEPCHRKPGTALDKAVTKSVEERLQFWPDGVLLQKLP